MPGSLRLRSEPLNSLRLSGREKILIFFQVSDQDFSITLDAYFNVKWQDPRLGSSLFKNKTSGSTVRDKFTMTAVNVNILPKLWIPDLEIMDLMSFETHKILSRLEGEHLTVS